MKINLDAVKKTEEIIKVDETEENDLHNVEKMKIFLSDLRIVKFNLESFKTWVNYALNSYNSKDLIKDNFKGITKEQNEELEKLLNEIYHIANDIDCMF